MTDQFNSRKTSSEEKNIFKNMMLRLRLILRLMNDNRVNGLIKLLPFGSLAYLIFPFDFIPGGLINMIGAVDDVAVMWFGFTLFLELCPADVVDEHISLLTGRVTSTEDGDIVDGEVVELEE